MQVNFFQGKTYSKKFALKNVNNIEYVTINGEERYITTEFGFFIKLNNPNVVIEAIEAVFSKEEILEMAKACVAFERENYDSNSKYSYFYGFCPDVDKDGKIVNLEIEFYGSNTMKNVPPQNLRFAAQLSALRLANTKIVYLCR